MRYLPDENKNKISAASQTVGLGTMRIALKIWICLVYFCFGFQMILDLAHICRVKRI